MKNTERTKSETINGIKVPLIVNIKKGYLAGQNAYAKKVAPVTAMGYKYITDKGNGVSECGPFVDLPGVIITVQADCPDTGAEVEQGYIVLRNDDGLVSDFLGTADEKYPLEVSNSSATEFFQAQGLNLISTKY